MTQITRAAHNHLAKQYGTGYRHAAAMLGADAAAVLYIGRDDARIAALQNEAIQARDDAMADACDLALGTAYPSPERTIVAKCILEALESAL